MIIKYGIDFGTTNSSIAIWTADSQDGKAVNFINPEAISGNKDNWRTYVVPSSFCWTSRTKEVLVGYEAKQEAQEALRRRFRIKKFPNPKVELEKSFEPESLYYTTPDGSRYTVIDLITVMFKRLKEIADDPANKRLIGTPDGVVLGLPVGYAQDNLRDLKQNLLIKALYEAGFYSSMEEALEKTEFVPEPVAAALNFENRFRADKNVFVFDYGGGTLDVAAINLKKSTSSELYPHEVLNKGTARNGGEFLTKAFFINCIAPRYGIDYLAEEFGLDIDTQNKDAVKAAETWDKLLTHPAGIDFIEAIDNLKCRLSFQSQQDIDEEIMFSFSGHSDDKDYYVETEYFTRADFEAAIADEIRDIPSLIQRTLSGANLTSKDIHEVLMVGGSSLIPAVRNILAQQFGTTKVKRGLDITEKNSIDTMLGVVSGLAFAGYRTDAAEIRFEDKTESNYGILANDAPQFIILKNTPIKDTFFDKEEMVGMYKDFMAKDLDPEFVCVEIYENDKKLGEFRVERPQARRFRIFMTIDNKKNWLTVHVYNRDKQRWYDNIPLESRQIKIK